VKVGILAGSVLIVAVAIGFYVALLTGGPTPYTVPVAGSGASRSVDLTLQTVAAVGPKLSPHETWVSYLVREGGVCT